MSEALMCKCRAVLGQEVEVDGLTLLSVGGVCVRYMHGFCERCGEEVHWSVSDRLLQKMLKGRINGITGEVEKSD
ncbi:MAG: hypothetical protein IT308_07625 [Anaerolineaceae bacterium]|nr:hypothetical protein [Anaerolineaceae bacterium]